MSLTRTLARQPPALPILAALWLIVVIGLVAFDTNAFALSTLTTILQFSTLLALVALGQSLVVLCGGAGIDLSVGGATSLSAVLPMLALKAGLPAALIPVACLGCGALLGVGNGFLVTRLRILPLIATLGTYYVYSGLAVSLTNGAAQGGVPAWLIPWGRGAIGGVPLPFLSLALPAFLLAWIALALTAWGRWIYALGHNERSARLVGIDVDRMRRVAYCVSGLLAGAAGLVSLAWLGSGRPNIGDNLELTSLTAAMLGGINIFGGRGSVAAVLAAVVLLVTVQTALLQLNVNTIWQVGIIGALLIATLLADRLSHRWR
jgi:ribose transport system permease protein